MAFTKRDYVDGQTIITAQNLNDIQDEILTNTVSNFSLVTNTSSQNYRYLQKIRNGSTYNVVRIGTVAVLDIEEVTT